MLERRTAHAVCEIGCLEEVVAVAGFTPTYKSTASCEILRRPQNKWKALPRQVSKKDTPGLSSLNGTQLFCFGGWIKKKRHLPNIEMLCMMSLGRGWKLLNIRLISKDNHMGVARPSPSHLFIFGGENKTNDSIFEFGKEPTALDTRIDYDTLMGGNCFKVFRGQVVAINQLLKVQIYHHNNWTLFE